MSLDRETARVALRTLIAPNREKFRLVTVSSSATASAPSPP
jgi:hypothetical protein